MSIALSTTAHPRSGRAGLTLIEIMIALTMTLIVLGAMMTAFQYASVEMQNGRAIMELANRSRSVEDMLRTDLQSITLDPRPYTGSTIPNGYLEYIEGGRRDATDAGNIRSYLGDVDDVLAMTIRAQDGNLYRGRGPGGIAESSLAEVIWYTTLLDRSGDGVVDFDESVRIHRRLLLIRPDFGVLNGGTPLDATQVTNLLATTDISCRVVQVTGGANPTYNVIANDLIDLGHRSNRFAHDISAFPHVFSRAQSVARLHSNQDDIMLTDVAAFDVRAYSPDSAVKVDGVGIVIEPGDANYTGSAVAETTLGSFVDLDHAGGSGWFSGPASAKSQLNYEDFPGSGVFANVYDTWTPVYESDGVDQDGDGTIDEGTNGLDDGGDTNAPDDNGERETEPPYPNPLRGLKITLRLVEKGTKQVHQTSIVHSFVPE